MSFFDILDHNQTERNAKKHIFRCDECGNPNICGLRRESSYKSTFNDHRLHAHCQNTLSNLKKERRN